MPVNEREQHICDNMGLVHACCKRFLGRGIEYDDLFQAGCMGLIKATDGFEPERGLRFSTYAVPVILGEIRRLFREGGTVKVGRTLKELSLKVTRHREEFVKEQGREPAVSELAVQLDLSIEQVTEALSAALPPLSLTRSGEEDEGEEIDLPIPPPEEAVTDRMALHQVLNELEERDRMLITLRYMGRQTQQSTADRLGMTQVQVSRREKAILRELREKLIS